MFPQWLNWLRWIFAVLVIARVMQWTDANWGNQREIAVALLLLALWTAAKGTETAARTASILRWFLTAILAAVFLASVKEMRLENLKPTWKWDWNNADLVLVFLLPAAFPLPAFKRNPCKWKTLVFALGASVITTGVMTVNCTQNAFYEMTRSLTLFGTAKRLESLASVAMVLGYFSLLVLLLQNSYPQTQNNNKRAWITALLSVIAYLLPISMPFACLPCLAVMVWLILPAICLVTNKLKKSEKKG